MRTIIVLFAACLLCGCEDWNKKADTKPTTKAGPGGTSSTETPTGDPNAKTPDTTTKIEIGGVEIPIPKIETPTLTPTVPETRTVTVLMDDLKKQKDMKAREDIVAGMGRLGGDAKAAVPSLIALMKAEGYPSVRRQAAISLGKIGAADPSSQKTIVPALANLLKDHYWQDRAGAELFDGAYKGLDEIGTGATAAIPVLTTALGAQSRQRERVLKLLTKIDEPASITALAKVLKDPDPRAREFACDSLTRLELIPTGAEKTIQDIAAKDKDENTRAAAQRLLKAGKKQ